MKNLKAVALAGSLIVGAVALWELTFEVFALLHVYGVVLPAEIRNGSWFIPVFVMFPILFLLRKKVTLWEYVFRPLWLMIGVFFWPDLGIGAFCCSLALMGWSAWRFGSLQKRKSARSLRYLKNMLPPLLPLLPHLCYGGCGICNVRLLTDFF